PTLTSFSLALQRHAGSRVQVHSGKMFLLESYESRGGNHGGIIGGEVAVWKEDLDSTGAGVPFKPSPQFAVRGDAGGHQNGFYTTLFHGGHAAIDQIAHDGPLEFPDKAESRRIAKGHQLSESAMSLAESFFALLNSLGVFRVFAQVIKHGGL